MTRLVRNIASCTRDAHRLAGLYLELSHGRNDPHEVMRGWGFDGPIIGPLKFVHTTYACDVRIEFEDIETARRNGFDDVYQTLDIVKDGFLVCNEKYYGDWTVQYNAGGDNKS